MDTLEDVSAPTWETQLNSIAPLGVGIGYDISAEGLNYQDLFRCLGKQINYLESHPIYKQKVLDQIQESVGYEVPFILHYNDLGICDPSLEVEDHAEIINGLCDLMSPPWFVEDFGYWSLDGRQFYSFMPPVLTEESLETTCRNMLALQEKVKVPYLPENPAFMFAVGPMHILEFAGELSRRTNCGLLLDVGHLYSYQVLNGREPLQDLHFLPLDRVYEIHIAGGDVVRSTSGYRYFDDNHSRPIAPAVLDMLAEILPKATNLRAVTVEVDFNQAAKSVVDPLATAVENFQNVRSLAARRWTNCPWSEN